jgi:hypothetical protein
VTLLFILILLVIAVSGVKILYWLFRLSLSAALLVGSLIALAGLCLVGGAHP